MCNVNTPYDDVFRTLLVDCKGLIIPVVNEVFGEHFTGNEKVILKENEIFLRQQNGDEEKRITDSSFAIVGIGENYSKQYHLECQSTADGSMLIRMYEYDSQIALKAGILEGTVLNVHLINGRLEQMCMEEVLDRYTKMTICEMAQKVIQALANKYVNVRKEVASVMGGKVLEYKAKDILRQGESIGREIGKEIGKEIGLEALVNTLKEILPDENAVYETVIKNDEYQDVTLEQIKKYYRKSN